VCGKSFISIIFKCLGSENVDIEDLRERSRMTIENFKEALSIVGYEPNRAFNPGESLAVSVNPSIGRFHLSRNGGYKRCL
jgi:hypothetical protein